MAKIKEIIESILNYLKSMKCRSKCCSGSECACGDSPTLKNNVDVLKVASASAK